MGTDGYLDNIFRVVNKLNLNMQGSAG